MRSAQVMLILISCEQQFLRSLARTGRTENEAMQHFTESNPQGRLVEASEVASAVSWLCSDGAASVTGQAVAIDGGGTA